MSERSKLNADDGVLCLVCFEYREQGAPCPNGCIEEQAR